MALLALAPWFALNVGRWERGLGLTLLAGTVILGFGFANVGIRTPGIPIPATELLLAPLVVAAIVRHESRLSGRIIGLLILYVGMFIVRLAIDVPTWGYLAVRDATIGLESVALLAGFRAIQRDGVEYWIRRLGAVFILLLAYASLYPFRDQLAHIGPTVGLQRDEALLGQMAGVGLGLIPALLYFALYAKGIPRIILIAWSLAILAMFESRGLYLALPIGMFVLGWARNKISRTVLHLAVPLLLLIMALPLAERVQLQGRLGPVDAEFFSTHIGTLFGGEGPGEGSVRDRITWTQLALEQWNHTPLTRVFGVGLGDDLISGFSRGPGVLVRKPHNDYLEMLVRMGIVGVLIFCTLMVLMVKRIARCARSSVGADGEFCAWVLSASSTYILIAATQPILAFPYGTVPLLMFLGMGLCAASRQDVVGATTEPLLENNNVNNPTSIGVASSRPFRA
jgi:O-antigen ligase/polysaccharide polymerase Wzy-like membrane protein